MGHTPPNAMTFILRNSREPRDLNRPRFRPRRRPALAYIPKKVLFPAGRWDSGSGYNTDRAGGAFFRFPREYPIPVIIPQENAPTQSFRRGARIYMLSRVFHILVALGNKLGHKSPPLIQDGRTQGRFPPGTANAGPLPCFPSTGTPSLIADFIKYRPSSVSMADNSSGV